MRTFFQRVSRHICLDHVSGRGAGALGGYLLGHTFALRQAEARLDRFANRILLESVTSSAESRAVLATMNTSPYALCSDTELEYFRQLIFQSQFLKAAGRMRDGRINCSTTSGRTELVEAQYTPNIARLDGTKIYKNLPPFRVDDQDVILVQMGESFIVYNPYNLSSLESPPMHFTGTALDAQTHQAGQMLGETTNIQQSILVREGKAAGRRYRLRHALLCRRNNLHDCLYRDARCIGDHPRLLDGLRSAGCGFGRDYRIDIPIALQSQQKRGAAIDPRNSSRRSHRGLSADCRSCHRSYR